MDEIESLVLLQNERDKRVFLWLKERFSDAELRAGLLSIPGNRKPYLTNLCAALNVSPPEVLKYVTKSEARPYFEKIKAMLK